tara:strand:- start:881 stop:2050 length:1170 start_codon:yes stop_codon:yes gene_type:complete
MRKTIVAEIVEVDIDNLVPLFKENVESTFYGRDSIDYGFHSLSLNDTGQITPILITYSLRNDGKAHIISGTKRYNAAIKNGMKTLKAEVREVENYTEAIILYFNANVQLGDSQKPLKVIDLIKGLKSQQTKSKGELNGNGNIPEQLAKILNITPLYAKQLESLNNLIPEFQDVLSKKILKTREAIPLSSLPEETQKTIFSLYNENPGELNIKDLVKENKEQSKKISEMVHQISSLDDKIKFYESKNNSDKVPSLDFENADEKLREMGEKIKEATELKFKKEKEESDKVIKELQEEREILSKELEKISKKADLNNGSDEDENKKLEMDIIKHASNLAGVYRLIEQYFTKYAQNPEANLKDVKPFVMGILADIQNKHEYFTSSAKKMVGEG